MKLAARLVFTAFSSKFSSIQSLSEVQQLALFEQLWLLHSANQYEAQFVIKNQGQVIATFAIISNMPRVEPRKKPQLRYVSLIKNYGLFSVCRMWLVCSLFDYKPNKKEAYIAYIAVAENQQKRGVGSVILDYAQHYARNLLKKSHLSLYVAQNNLAAAALYKRHGFVERRKQKSWLTAGLTRVTSWSYQVKEL
ncbi:GNAT family N-acetyltransferase [Pseudomonas sp. F1_0610]|uniref:GNAT family N-acetyltransferase n=1 Tax=Pseudomonas sp. F1_0610 TaxID=3114284 RepID=UPI0039C4D468